VLCSAYVLLVKRCFTNYSWWWWWRLLLLLKKYYL